MSSEQSDTATGDDEPLTFETLYVCPRCTLVYATNEDGHCHACDYEGDRHEFKVEQ